MKLCDLDQRVIVPVVDETRGGMRYELEMSVGELLGKALEGFKPAVVEAVPVEWIKSRWGNNILFFSDRQWCEQWLIDDWQKEQDEQDSKT